MEFINSFNYIVQPGTFDNDLSSIPTGKLFIFFVELFNLPNGLIVSILLVIVGLLKFDLL